MRAAPLCPADRCPGFSATVLAPITALLVFALAGTWLDVLWTRQQYTNNGPTDWFGCGLIALLGPAVAVVSAIRSKTWHVGLWMRLLRIEKRTLLIVIPLTLYTLLCISAAAVI